MKRDVLDRLRELNVGIVPLELVDEAAAEIERLREDRDTFLEVLARLYAELVLA